MKKFKFYSEIDEWFGKQWFVDLPYFPGEKGELQMVSGADIMLDLMSEGETIVEIFISLEEFEGCDILTFIRETSELENGANYQLNSVNGVSYNFEVWLCDVTKYVFGKFPENIYLKKSK